MLFLAGLFVGVILGFMVHSMLVVAKWDDEIQEIKNVKTDLPVKSSRVVRS